MSCNPTIDSIPYIGCCPSVLEAQWFGLSCSVSRSFLLPGSGTNLDFINAMVAALATIEFIALEGADYTWWGMWSYPPSPTEYFGTAIPEGYGSDVINDPTCAAHCRDWFNDAQYEGRVEHVLEAQRIKLIVPSPEIVCLVTRRREWNGLITEESCSQVQVDSELIVEPPAPYIDPSTPIIGGITGRYIHVQRSSTPVSQLGTCCNFAP